MPEAAVWIDLANPTSGEDKLIERLVGIAVPTREEMQEIEVSSRLYTENGARYMTATLMCQSDSAAEDHGGYLYPGRSPADHCALRRTETVSRSSAISSGEVVLPG